MNISNEKKKQLKKKGKQLLKDGKEFLETDGAELYYTAKNKAWNEIHNLGDKLLPTLKGSGFQNGMLTPEEFVAAGDNLVALYGSWKWCGAMKSDGRKSFLPDDKQYLITIQVPCEKRANDMSNVELTDDGEWGKVKYENEYGNKSYNSIEDLEVEMVKLKSNDQKVVEDEYGFEDLEDNEDLAAVQGGNLVMCRRYTIYITYDNYYRTPRVWLSGISEYGFPLNHHEIFEDIVEEYRNRTVTLETFPYSKQSMVSIHPCKHAETMKSFIGRTNITQKDYMFVFLKFISSVLPTINYDFTGSVNFS